MTDLGGTPGWRERLAQAAKDAADCGLAYTRAARAADIRTALAAVENVEEAAQAQIDAMQREIDALAAAAPSPQEGGGGASADVIAYVSGAVLDALWQQFADAVPDGVFDPAALNASYEGWRGVAVAAVEALPLSSPTPVALEEACQDVIERALLDAGVEDRDACRIAPGVLSALFDGPLAALPAPPPAGVQVDREALAVKVREQIERALTREATEQSRSGRNRAAVEWDAAARFVRDLPLAPLLGSPGETP